MENETKVTTLTYEEIMKWDGAKMKTEMATRRAEIDEVLRQKSEEVAAQLTGQNERLGALEAAKLQRKQELDAEREKAQRDREAEVVRLSRMTSEERKTEYEAQIAAQAEAERVEEAARIAQERDDSYLNSLRPAERQAELDRRVAEKAAVEDAQAKEAERLAAEAAQKEADEKAAADKVAADKIAADVAAKSEAEKKSLEDAQRIIAEEAAKPKEKIIREYQNRDEAGNPIGRPTHLEADSWEEMAEKLQACHENAVRFAERMKKRASIKPEFKQPEVPIELLSEEQLLKIQKDLESKDEIAQSKAKVAFELNEARKLQLKNRRQEDFNRGQAVSLEFRKNHPEFNACEANAKILGDYIQENKLEWTVDNLELAFAEREKELAPRVENNPPQVADTTAADAEAARVQAEAEATAKAAAEVEAKKKIEQEQAAANTAAATAPVAATASAAASTPVEAPVAAINPPELPARKLPAAGIEPGTLHGGRATGTTKPAGLTKQEVARMTNTPEGRATFRRKLKDPNFVKQLNAIGIKA